MGFTLVELLVVIAIIGTLMALLLPAIFHARETARMNTCRNNQKNISLAMINFAAATSDGTFPGWASNQTFQNGNPYPITWAAKLLPQLDQQTLWNQMLTGATPSSPGYVYLNPGKMEVLVCPDDEGTNPKLGTLTYIVNAGMPDTTKTPLPTGAFTDVKANGVCHDQRPGRNGPSVKASTDVPDGSDMTLLVSENVQKDPQASNGDPATWMGPLQTNVLGLADMTTNPEQRFGMTWIVGNNPPGPPDMQKDFVPISKDTNPPESSYSSPSGSYYKFARPASVHPDIFVAAFCGGSVKTIRNDIEYRVYQQLMTPNGLKAEIPNNSPKMMIERQLEASGKGFMIPPLNSGDF